MMKKINIFSAIILIFLFCNSQLSFAGNHLTKFERNLAISHSRLGADSLSEAELAQFNFKLDSLKKKYPRMSFATRPIPVLNAKALEEMFGDTTSHIYICHYRWGLINSNVASFRLYSSLKKQGDKNIINFGLRGTTYSFYRVFFKILEDFSANFSAENLLPQQYKRITREGSYYANDEYAYIWQPKKYIDASLDDKFKSKRNLHLPLNNCTFDFVSILAQVRAADIEKMQKNSDFIYNLVLSDEISTCKIQYLGREKVKIEGSEEGQNALKFSFLLMGGQQFNNNTKLYIWFSDDKERLPLKFTTPIKIGTVSGYLKR